MATHSSTLAWKILWMEERGRLRSMGSQRVGTTDFALLRQWGKLSNVTSYEGNGLVISPDMELLCKMTKTTSWLVDSCLLHDLTVFSLAPSAFSFLPYFLPPVDLK